MRSQLLVYFAIAIFFLLALSSRGQTQPAPPFVWANASGGSDYDSGEQVATDTAGNSYMAGRFWGTTHFAGVTLVSQGFQDIYLAKYDPQGSLLWLRQAGGIGSEEVYDLAVDAAGNVVLTGSFYGHNTPALFSTMSFGSTTLTGGSTFYEMFLAKYDTQGTFLWAQQTVSQPQSIGCVGTEVALDTQGNIYVGGYHDGPARFSTATIPSSTPVGLFLAKYNAQGQLAWLRAGLGDRGGAVAFDFLQVAVSASADVYLLCRYKAAVTLSPTTTLPSNTTPHGEYYLAKLDSKGSLQWVRQDVLTAVESCTDLACSPTGNLVFACSYTDPTTHGGQRFTPRTSIDLLLLSFSAQGNFLWGQMPSLAGAASPASGPVALDGQGNIYTVFSSSQVACYSPSGVLRWQRVSPYFVLALAVSAPNQVMLAGCIDSSVVFDNIGLTSVGNMDAFVAKLSGLAFPGSPADPGPLATFIPTIITPNGDGVNDHFRLPGLPAGPWQLRVFSRWGRLVYTVDDYQQDWQAAGLADGQYYYQLQGPSRQQIQGWLEVLH